MTGNSDPFRAIADPNRRLILDLLREAPQSVGDLTRNVGVSQPAVSQHLAILREAGLVDFTSRGRQRIFHVEGQSLAQVHDWLARYEAFWDRGLDRLGQHLDRRRN